MKKFSITVLPILMAFYIAVSPISSLKVSAASVTVRTTDVKSITSTNAVVYGNVAKDNGVTIQTAGVYFGEAGSNMFKISESVPESVSRTYKNFNIWYDLTKYGYLLQPGTTYCWQAFATYNGAEFFGDVKSFTTSGSKLSSALSSTVDPGIPVIRVDTATARGITQTNAIVYGYCAKPQSTKIETCGIYFGTSPDNMFKATSESVSAAANNPKNGDGFELWYDLNKHGQKLQPGTTYYWQCYATYNGTEYRGDIKSFTTNPESGGGSGSLETSTYIWPVPDSASTSRGYSSTHKGLDIKGGNLTIVASRSGTVYALYTGCNNYSGIANGSCRSRNKCNPNAGYYGGYCNNGFGNGLIIKHNDGSFSSYAHMSSITAGLKAGSKINQGDILGTTGSSGNSSGPHLHFELHWADEKFWPKDSNGKTIDSSVDPSFIKP